MDYIPLHIMWQKYHSRTIDDHSEYGTVVGHCISGLGSLPWRSGNVMMEPDRLQSMGSQRVGHN